MANMLVTYWREKVFPNEHLLCPLLRPNGPDMTFVFIFGSQWWPTDPTCAPIDLLWVVWGSLRRPLERPGGLGSAELRGLHDAKLHISSE